MATWSKSSPLVHNEPHLPVLQKTESLREVGEKPTKNVRFEKMKRREELLKLAALHKNIDAPFQASPSSRRLAISAELLRTISSDSESDTNGETNSTTTTTDDLESNAGTEEKVSNNDTNSSSDDEQQQGDSTKAASTVSDEPESREVRRASSSILNIDPTKQTESTDDEKVLSQSTPLPLPSSRISGIISEWIPSVVVLFCCRNE